MKQDSIAWKFRTQNLVATYILTLMTNLEHFLKSILDMTYMILKLENLGVQQFKWCPNQS